LITKQVKPSPKRIKVGAITTPIINQVATWRNMVRANNKAREAMGKI
jgi:hypothetical protein